MQTTNGHYVKQFINQSIIELRIECILTKFVRTHDYLYLDENRYQDPKQLHLEIINYIKFAESNDNSLNLLSILDAGCAAGEFAYLLNKEFSSTQISGFDVLKELINKARKEVSGVNFFEANVLDLAAAQENSFDVVTCTGVLSIFDDFREIINNLIHWTKPGGYIFIHSLFSDYPFDVRVQYNASNDYGKGVLETGWNIFSKESITTFLESVINRQSDEEFSGRGLIESFVFHNFSIERELKKKSDLIRSWTFRDERGDLKITNGLNLLQPHAILQIKKSKK